MNQSVPTFTASGTPAGPGTLIACTIILGAVGLIGGDDPGIPRLGDSIRSNRNATNSARHNSCSPCIGIEIAGAALSTALSARAHFLAPR
ncbi:MAG TPA: hypothetical protein VE866_16350 [Candidatus Binatia bacterium]|nr:hypothetical protein [Candidatus Binatia bacterium]